MGFMDWLFGKDIDFNDCMEKIEELSTRITYLEKKTEYIVDELFGTDTVLLKNNDTGQAPHNPSTTIPAITIARAAIRAHFKKGAIFETEEVQEVLTTWSPESSTWSKKKIGNTTYNALCSLVRVKKVKKIDHHTWTVL